MILFRQGCFAGAGLSACIPRYLANLEKNNIEQGMPFDKPFAAISSQCSSGLFCYFGQ
jgi:hypothetical protein